MTPPPFSTHPADIVRAGVYSRQSLARLDSSEASTETQNSAGTALAVARGWGDSVRSYSDVGRSGWDPSVVRTGFEEMMADVRAGLLDVVIVQELSRLTRQGALEAMRIDEELRKHGVRLVSVLEPFIDTSTPIGQAIFALIAALAKQDSDMKSQRLINTKAEIAALGGRHSSAPPYGMMAQREKVGKLVISVLVPNPEFEPNVMRMVELCESGATDGQIAKKFNEEQIPPPGMTDQRNTEARAADVAKRRMGEKERPMLWRAQTVRWILSHPAIGGFATVRVGNMHKIARDDAGRPLAPHTGIITAVRFLDLQKIRSANTVPRRRNGEDPALLAGWRIMTCGVCGGSMGKGTPTSYACSNPVGHGGLGISRKLLDNFVAQRVWARLSASDHDDPVIMAAALRFVQQQDTEGIEAKRREVQSHLDHVRQSIRDLQEDRKAGLYQGADELKTWRATMVQYREYETSCVAELETLSEESTVAVRLPAEWDVEPGADPLGKGSLWAGWSIVERREMLALFLSGITVLAGRDAEGQVIPVEQRVRLHWIGEPDV